MFYLLFFIHVYIFLYIYIFINLCIFKLIFLYTRAVNGRKPRFLINSVLPPFDNKELYEELCAVLGAVGAPRFQRPLAPGIWQRRNPGVRYGILAINDKQINN